MNLWVDNVYRLLFANKQLQIGYHSYYKYDEGDNSNEQSNPALVAARLLGLELILVPDSLLLHLLGHVVEILIIQIILLVVVFHKAIFEGLRSGLRYESLLPL